MRADFHALVYCLLLVLGCANAQTKVSPIKPQPIYEQCEKLNTGTATDDPVVKQIASLKEKDAKVRAQSALHLAKSCDGRAVDPLIDLLKDETPAVRVAAVEGLVHLGHPDSAGDLINQMGEKGTSVGIALISLVACIKTYTST